MIELLSDKVESMCGYKPPNEIITNFLAKIFDNPINRLVENNINTNQPKYYSKENESNFDTSLLKDQSIKQDSPKNIYQTKESFQQNQNQRQRQRQRQPSKKIRSFSFEGNEYPVKNGRECLRTLCKILLTKDSISFEKLLNLKDFSRNKNDLHSSGDLYQVEGTGIYMNINFDVDTSVELCYEIIRTLGFQGDVLKIEYGRDET